MPSNEEQEQEERRIANKRYRASPKGKAAQNRYKASDKGKATRARYNASNEGRANHARDQARYYARNHDRICAKNSMWASAHREYLNEYQREYRLEYGRAPRFLCDLCRHAAMINPRVDATRRQYDAVPEPIQSRNDRLQDSR